MADSRLIASMQDEDRQPQRAGGGMQVAGAPGLGRILRQAIKKGTDEAAEDSGKLIRKEGDEAVGEVEEGAAESGARSPRSPDHRPAGPPGVEETSEGGVRVERVGEDELESITERAEGIRGESPEEMPKYAVNINLHRISNPDQVNSLVRSVAQQYSDQVDVARRGVQTHEQTAALASELGLTPEQLLKRKQGEAWNAEHIFAARTILESARDRADELAKKVSSGEASKEELVQYRDAVSTYSGMMKQISGLAAEAGRALNQYKMLAQDTPMKRQEIDAMLSKFGGSDIERMADMWLTLDDPAKKAAFARDTADVTTMEMVVEAWINNLLSSPATHVVNTVSNTVVAGMQIPERAVAASITGVKRTLRPHGRRAEAGVEYAEAYGQMWGLYRGMIDGIRLGGKAFWKGEPTDAAEKLEMRSHRAITGENVGKALKRGGDNVNKILMNDVIPTDQIEVGGWLARAIDAYGELQRVPGRALLAEDEFFKSIGYRMQLNALAMRRALQETDDPAEVGRLVNEYLNNPPEEIHLAATEAAHYQTFTNQGGPVVKALQTMGHRAPLARFIIPFIRTPVNILKYTMERTPAAPIMKKVRAELMSQDPAVRDMAQARIAMGTMLMGSIVPFVAERQADCANRKVCITGSPPADYKESAWMRQGGFQSNSIKVGDKWYSYSRLDPLGQMIGIAADSAQLLKLMDAQGYDEETKTKFAAQLVMAVSNNVVNKTYMQGPAEFFEVFTSFDANQWEKYAQRMSGSGIPRILAGVERSMHPAWADAEGVVEEWKSQIPGLSEDLPPVRGFFGHPQEGGYMGPSMSMPAIWSPVWKSETNLSPFTKEVFRLDWYPSRPQRTISGVSLETEEYDEYIRAFGHALKPPEGTTVLGIDIGGMGLKKALDRIVQQSEYKQLTDSVDPPGGKVKVMRGVIGMYKDMAALHTMKKYPQIIQSVVESKKQELMAQGVSEEEATEQARIMADRYRQELASPEFEVTAP